VKTLKRHLTVANLISCIALFVALSSVAYAAAKLGKNQVKAKNIAKEAVTSPKLKKGAVTSAKLANGAVVNGKIANGAVTNGKLANEAVTAGKLAKNAVTANKIGADAVTTGKIGNEAVTSAKLSASLLGQLIRNITYVNALSAENNEGAKSATAFCPVGKQAIGGGARVNGELLEVAVTGSNPFVANNQRTGWSAFARELPDEPGAKIWSVEAFAVCAEL
jgi:hypothetical protein